MNEDINEIMADLSLTQDPQRQQPQSPAPRPDIIDQARGIPAPSDIVEQARVRPGFDTSKPVPVDGPMNAFAAQRMQALLDQPQQGMIPQQPPVPAMEEPPTIDETRQTIREMFAADSARLTSSFDQVYQTNSDFAARANRMAQSLGINLATVYRNPDDVQRLIDVMDLQSRDLVRNNPALAHDLTNPGFMAIAKDDLDNLSWWTSGANAWELGALNAEMGKLGHELKFLDDRGLKSEGEPIRMRIAEIRNRMAQLPVAEEGFGSFIGSAAQMGGLYGTFLPEAAATGAAVAIPATMIAGAATGPAAPIAAPLAGAAGFLKVSGASFTFQTAQVSSGLSYLEQVQNGVDPSVAYYTSSIAGIGEALLDRIGLKGAAEPAKKMLTEMTAKELAKALAKPTWGEIATKYGTDVVKVGLKETATEMGQDLVNIMAEDLGRSFTKGEIESRLATEEGRAEIYKRMAQTLEMTLKGQALLAPAFGSPTLFGGIYQRRAMAEQQKKVLEGIANNAAESKVRKRDPNVYETIVQNQLEQLEQLGGADAKTVYVAPERFLEAMQGVGMTEAELLKLLPDQIESIRESIRNGSDIQIPTAKFASTLADTDLGRALILDMRLSDNPNVLSAREAEEQGKQLREQLETAAKMVDEDIAADKALEAEIRAVENLFYEQNVRIPNIGKDNAKALSVMQTRMVHTLARESGMPLQQFYEKYRAQFTEAGKPPMFDPQVGAEPAELFDSLGQRKTDTPQFKAWFGESKVVDEQGQPLVVYHGTSATDIAAFMPTGDRAGMEKAQKVLDTFRQAKAARERFGYMNFRSGTFFSPDPEYARKYTREDAGVMYPVYIKAENPVYIDQVTGSSTISDSTKTPDALFMMEGGKINEIAIIDPTQIKSVNNRGTFDPASANILEQVEKLDADYMAAVERGDMENAQRMVDQAAKAAGYNRKAYHGSASKPFWVFDPAKRGQRTGSNSALLGFFASSERQVASEYQLTESERRRFNEPTQFAFGLEAAEAQYGRKTEIVTAGVFDKDQNGWVAQLTEYDQFGSEFTYEDEYVYDSQVEAENAAEEYKERQVKEAQAVLDKKLAEFAEEEKNLRAERTLHDLWVRLENPLIYDFKGGGFRDKSYTELVKEAIEDGHDGVVMRNTMDAIDSGTLSDVIVFFNSNQAKLADPVTRDEQGKIIPLSRRFNLQSPSILEQLGEPSSSDVVTAMQDAKAKGGYVNCKLCIQMATGVSNIDALPDVETAKVGDIYKFGIHHYALDIGNGMVVDVPEWGGEVETKTLASVIEEYDPPTAIKRPPAGAYASKKTLAQLGEEAQPRLMAVHNLTADNLRFADGIGGLAVPSVGVVTEEAGEVRGFGEITLIGTKSMIDPAREPVFTSDAYSQRFPDPKWRKPKVKNADALYNQVKDVSKEFGDELAYFVEELTGRRPNAGELLKKWLNSTAAKVLWLRSQGETVTPILSDPQFEFQLSVDALERIRPVFSAWFKADKDAEPSDRAQLPELAQLEQAFANEYSKVLIDDGYTAEEAARLTNTTIENRNIGMIFEKMYFALRQGRKPDVYANSEMVNKQLADREIEFRKWSEKQVFSKFDAPYLTLGRRSVPYTLDNIVDYMTRPDNIVGAETMPFGVTPGSVRAATSERLESLEQMRKAAKSSITDEAEYSKAADITSNKLGTYVDAVRSFSKYGGMDASDGAMRALAKFATRKTRTVEQLRKELAKEYYDAAKIPAEALELGVEAAEALLKAPVPYFEAKPQRAVNLNEFAGAVIPQDATQETKDLLTKNGIPFTTYASDTERTAVVRQFTQQLSQQRGDVLSQLADGPNPGFYSALLRSMDAVTAKALPANGWKDQIRGLVNKGTVKQAEVEWSGLNEWLDMQEGKVTKEAVVAFLQGNGVKVETEVFGARVDIPEYSAVRRAISDKADKRDAILVELRDIQDAQTALESPANLELMKSVADVIPDLQPFVGNQDAMIEKLAELESKKSKARRNIDVEIDNLMVERDNLKSKFNIRPDKFGGYTLPGGKDYREVLLALKQLPIDAYTRFTQSMRAKYGEDFIANMNTDESEKYSALQLMKRGFKNHHWSTPNVLAHLRMNDRVDADGKRVLFIEEVQSDWGQEGRERGFDAKAPDPQVVAAAEEKAKAARAARIARLAVVRQNTGIGTFEQALAAPNKDEAVRLYRETLNADEEYVRLRQEEDEAFAARDALYQQMSNAKTAIPRAPFVETTKGWVELALKKVMLIAAEGGYDRVAFTNGAENAQRYNLSKQISKVTYNQKTQELLALDLNGGLVFDQKVSPDKLHEYVGGEIAQKLTSESMRPTVMSREQYQSQYGLENMESQLIARQLSMGSQGPYGLLPDPTWFVVSNNRIIGEYQSQQAAQASKKINVVQLEGVDLDVGGEGMKAFYDKIMPNYLNDLLAKFGKTKSKMVNVEGIGEHLGFDVTPELLDKISEGLPLFSPKQRGTFDPRTLVSAIMSGGKSDTVMHEMWHYYFVMLERFALAGDAPPKLAQDFDTLLAWLKVPGATADERLAAWRNMTFEQRKPYHENTAYAWEIWLAKGEAPSVELEGIFKRMLRWFRETYNDIVTELKALYRQNYGRELILPTSEIEQIFARALASQEEIDRAMMVRNIQFPYSDAEQAQMRPETLGALKEMWEEMVEEAVINVTGKSISDMQWLSGAETPAMREMQKRHDTLREQVREQVAEQVRMEPIYRAMRHFQTGEMVAEDGTVSNAGSNYKLNSRMTQALLPEGKTLTNLRGMTNRKGLDPSEVAQWYGYPDGKTFVAALANAKPMTEEIKERTDKRMLEEHGDLVNPVQRQRAIERAINNDTRTQFLAAVLRHTDMALRKSVDALSPAAVKQVEQATAKLAELKQTREALRAQLRQAEEAKLAEVIDATNEQLRDNQRAIARERRKISGPITPVRDLVKAAERNADQTLATKKVGEVSSYRYGQQQARASRDAQEAVKKMDLAEVVRAQQKELILHALTKKAAEFEDFVADKLDDYRKFTKDTEKLRKTRDMDLVNVAKAILASYGMGVEVDGIDKRLERFKEANPELYAEFEGLITDAKTKARPYRELTVEEFQAVTDAVDRLWYEAKRRLEVGKEGERQALGEVVDLMIDRVAKIGMDATPPGTTGKETEAEKLAVQVVDMASCVTRIQHWCNKMDELTFGLEAGVFTKNIWRRIQNATSEYLLARDKKIKELADLSKALYTGGPTLYSKHLGYTFGRDRGHSGKAEILGMLLHMGNRDNLERLLTGRQITELGHPDKGKPWGAIDEVTGEVDTSRFIAAVQEFIADGTLTQADFDWVQSMWDKIEQVTENYVQPSHKLQTGDYLDLIPPDSFTIRFKDGTVKTYKGGYIPSKIDPAVSSKGRDIENFTELEQDVRQRRPKAADGMTKKRVQGVREPRIMDPMLVVQAIDEELRYSVLGPAINDVLKIANDDRLNEAMNRFDRGFIKKTLIPWLNVVATQRITQPPLGGQLSGRVFTGLRTSVAMQALGFNVLNAAQNITGIPTGIYKAGPITYAKAVAEFIYNPKKVIDVIVNSDGIMAERLRLTMFDAETEMKRIFENPSAFNTTMTYVRSSMMILQKVSQNLIDITVWLASYNKAMRSMGADKNNAEAHAEAVRRARETVTLTQYSQRPEDVAKIEVKPAEVRVFTQFFGYINGLAQLAGGEWKKYIRSDLGLPSKAAGLVYIYLLCWLAPSLINDLLKRAATDDWEDEDDNGYIDGMFYDVAIKPSMQSVPVVGQVAELAANGFDDKPYNDRLNIAPAVSMVSGAVSEAAKSANKWIRSGELGEEQIYDWITLMGYLTKFPTRPFVKPLEYEAQVEAGKVQPTSSYDYYRGLITGRASPESKQ